jgi:hypothetical protein
MAFLENFAKEFEDAETAKKRSTKTRPPTRFAPGNSFGLVARRG